MIKQKKIGTSGRNSRELPNFGNLYAFLRNLIKNITLNNSKDLDQTIEKIPTGTLEKFSQERLYLIFMRYLGSFLE